MLYPIISFFRMLLALIILGFGQVVSAIADDLVEFVEPPHLLMELSSGQILDSHRMDARWAPASLTKMMSAYTVFRALDLQHLALNSPVRISEEALAEPPSKMGFPIGTILTVDAALKIILVKSANDVSVALAEGVAGSEQSFVNLMNAHARRLGMTDTNFVNPHGLHDPEQYTSVRDMALLVRAIKAKYPQHAGFFDIPAIRVGGRKLRNHNALLRLFEGTTGMKTGYVCASGFNIAVTVEREGRELLAIVFGGRSGLARNVRAARLLTEGFDGVFRQSKLGTVNAPRDLVSGGIPDDITRLTCPAKYAATGKPEARPADAPVAGDFDRIDTRIIPAEKTEAIETQDDVALPRPRPEYEPPEKSDEKPLATVSSDIEVRLGPEVDEQSGKPLPPSLAELSKIYLKPVSKPGKDQTIRLGGATGPNPFGIKHTNGGPFVAPTPIPKTKPRS